LIVTLIILTLLNDKIKKNIVYQVGAYVAIIVSALDMFGVGLVKALPFTSLGLNWVLPVIICCLLANFLPIGKVNEDINDQNCMKDA
ncbi:MAG: branched-chain amino acid transport system II carrier protein, partial [Intestinibacter sp.]|uniref:branched-chain amino acid transport system II carrier protein n=1 Tax=Intestinibacter sp. TaxID=1965304 RepID=UPI003F13A1BB